MIWVNLLFKGDNYSTNLMLFNFSLRNRCNWHCTGLLVTEEIFCLLSFPQRLLFSLFSFFMEKMTSKILRTAYNNIHYKQSTGNDKLTSGSHLLQDLVDNLFAASQYSLQGDHCQLNYCSIFIFQRRMQIQRSETLVNFRSSWNPYVQRPWWLGTWKMKNTRRIKQQY